MESAELEEFQDISKIGENKIPTEGLVNIKRAVMEDTNKIKEISTMFSDDDDDIPNLKNKRSLKRVVEGLLSDDDPTEECDDTVEQVAQKLLEEIRDESHASDISNTPDTTNSNTSNDTKESSNSASKVSSLSHTDGSIKQSHDTDDEFGIAEFDSQEDLQCSLKASTAVNSPCKTDTDMQHDSHDRKSKKRSSWIQCDQPDCQKWRRLDHVDDTTLVADGKWVCCMNEDNKFNDCNCTQETIPSSEDESACTSFKPGALVLGRMPGYPWWPGIIEDDPDFDSYFYLDKKKDKTVVSYHVTFLGKDVSRAWLTEVAVTNFDGHESLADLGKLSYQGKHFGRAVTSALNEAKVAMEFSMEKRVRRYGFLRRYKGTDKPKVSEKTKKNEKTKKIERLSSEKNVRSSEDEKRKETKHQAALNRKPTARNIKESKVSKEERKRLKNERKKQFKLIENNVKTQYKPIDAKLTTTDHSTASSNVKDNLGNVKEKSTSTERMPSKKPVSKEDEDGDVDVEMFDADARTESVDDTVNMINPKKIPNVINVRTEEKQQNTDASVDTTTQVQETKELSQELTENQKHADAMVLKYIDPQHLETVLINVDPSKEKTKVPKLPKEKKEKIAKGSKQTEKKKKKNSTNGTDEFGKKKKSINENSDASKKKGKKKKDGSEDKAKVPAFNAKKKSKKIENKDKTAQATEVLQKESIQVSTDETKLEVEIEKEQAEIHNSEQSKEELPSSNEDNKQQASKKDEQSAASSSKEEQKMNADTITKDVDIVSNKNSIDTGKETKELVKKKKKNDDEKLKEKKPEKEKKLKASNESNKSGKNVNPDNDNEFPEANVSTKKEKLPKLVKPVLPSVSAEEILKNKDKTDKPVPKLKKTSFKAPVKSDGSTKMAPSFSAPKKKTLGVKRPNIRTTEEEVLSEPVNKKPFLEAELDLNNLLTEDRPGEEKENMLHDSPEF